MFFIKVNLVTLVASPAGRGVFFFFRQAALALLVRRGEGHPVVDQVHLQVAPHHELPKPPSQTLVVRRVVKAELLGVLQELFELVRQASAQLLVGHGHLFVHDEPVLLQAARGVHALPGQVALEQVKQNVGDALQVVPAARLDPGMGVN